MNEDNDIFDLFLALLEKLQENKPDGRMRLLSKEPRYAADDPAQQFEKNKAHKEHSCNP